MVKSSKKTIWTLSQQNNMIVATNVETGETKSFTPGDSKYNKLKQYKKANKLLSIGPTGRMQARKDYEGYLQTTKSTSVSQNTNNKNKKNVKPKLTRLNDLSFSPELFIPMRTYTPVDNVLSSEYGFLPGTNIMCAGAPGSGKTTVLMELIWAVQHHYPDKKVLFISAEMNKLDLARYQQRFPHWGDIPMLFMEDLHEGYVKEGVEATLQDGWDIVLTDSYTHINDTVKEDSNMTSTKTEKWFLNLMESNNMAYNDLKKHTAFITILQLSKSGKFVGSNKLKHLTTAMMRMNWEGDENSENRYIEFSKNRVGPVGKKLYFKINGHVEYDEERFQREVLNEQAIAHEQEKLKDESNAFDTLFGDTNEPAGEENLDENLNEEA
jgi:predicted ATP-dependent serine protease